MTPSYMSRNIAPVLSVLLLALLATSSVASTQDGEEARWLVKKSRWATLSWLENEDLKSFVTSIAESDGRIFFYLQEKTTFKATITLSEAQTNSTQFFGAKCGPDGALDPQDPRCAKLSIFGEVSPCEGDAKQVALNALYATHPQMKDWPEDHGFTACEMKIKEENGLWMIANFGGGGYMNAADYHSSDPVYHPVKGFGGRSRQLTSSNSFIERRLEGSASCYNPTNHVCECTTEKCGKTLCESGGGIWSDMCQGSCDCVDPSGNAPAPVTSQSGGNGGGHGGGHGEGDGTGGGEHHEHHHEGGPGGENGGHEHHGSPPKMVPRPDFGDDAAGHARWIVAKSLWTTISTISSTNEGETFGNIRSVADGACFLGSSGLPYFNVPSPDPTAIDIGSDHRIVLSFTEASLAERVSGDGIPCEGKDAEDPTCAKISLIGHAKPLESDEDIEMAEQAFAAQHPRAPWLATGGGHTGGKYYSIHLHEIMFLRNYGGFATVSPDEYMNWKPDPSKNGEEQACAMVGHGLKKEGNSGSMGEYQPSASTASSTDSSTTSSFSSYAIMLVITASFVGSFFGGLLAEKVTAYWRSRRNLYTTTGQTDIDSLKLTVSKAESC